MVWVQAARGGQVKDSEQIIYIKMFIHASFNSEHSVKPLFDLRPLIDLSSLLVFAAFSNLYTHTSVLLLQTLLLQPTVQNSHWFNTWCAIISPQPNWLDKEFAASGDLRRWCLADYPRTCVGAQPRSPERHSSSAVSIAALQWRRLNHNYSTLAHFWNKKLL